MMANSLELDAVFGPDSEGETPELRARSSSQQFVRSQTQLAFNTSRATGKRLNAAQALELVGWEKLRELADFSAVSLIVKAGEPYALIGKRLSDMNLSLPDVAKRAGWGKEDLQLFQAKRPIPIRLLERLASKLALNEDLLGLNTEAGDYDLGIRLREVAGSTTRLSMSAVLSLAEAAWIIDHQARLERKLGATHSEYRPLFRPNSDYGNCENPAWQVGYELAKLTRTNLGLSPDEPIDNLVRIIEDKLRIPVIQMELPSEIAGATISNEGVRGIVVNLNGANKNVWARRITLAHELGHLLWDPEDRLRRLIVDTYKNIEGAPTKIIDYVEMRANSFAIELLAPRAAVIKYFESSGSDSDAVVQVMHRFGISKTAAAYHIENAYNRQVRINRREVHEEPSADWMGREQLTIDYFEPTCIPISRRGNFASYVYKAVENHLISVDTAASLLACPPSEIEKALQFLKMVYS